ncbi:MAG: OmpA family protein [Bacteroidia bacterium]|jgi:peptidoglycan-associated lipoprotein
MSSCRYFALAFLIIAFTFITPAKLFAQMGAGDKAFALESYYVAIDAYKKAIKSKEKKALATFKVAECYRLMNDNKLAESWYARAIKAGYDEPELYLNYASVLRGMEKYDDAIEQYNIYLGLNPSDNRAKWLLESCKLAKTWMNTPSRNEVNNMRTFNSRQSDYALTLYKNNGVIISSTREDATGKKVYGRIGEDFSDLFESFVDRRGKWSKLKVIEGDVNTGFNEGTATVNRTGTIMYFTRCSSKTGECKIYQARKGGTKWTNAEVVEIFGDTVNVGQPSLSKDQKKLYFVADNAEGGYGGKDIWYMNKGRGDTWEEPINLGPAINTEFDEMFPYIHEDDQTLYFASDGHPGMGGLDIFMSEGQGTEWSQPENLKYPINSGADDFAYIANARKDKGFLSSNRPGGRGSDDIWQWVLTPLVFNLSGMVYDDSTRRPLSGAEVRLIMEDSTYIEAITDNKGMYTFKLREGMSYRIEVTRKDYFGEDTSLTTRGLEDSKDFVINIPLKLVPIEEITLNDILYEFNSDKLTAKSKENLVVLINMMKKSENLRISINSHTDSRGSDAFNQDLSQRRAQSVVNYLIENGIDSARLEAKGYGESQLLNHCADGVKCSEEEHAINRRTTFKVLSTDFKGIIKYRRVTGDEEEETDQIFTDPNKE